MWFLSFSMFLIVTHWYTQIPFPTNLFFSVSHCNYSLIYTNPDFQRICFSVFLIVTTHWYTQIPFPTNVFFSVTHSSNMFYSVVLSFSMFLIVTHWYTQIPFPTNLFFSVSHCTTHWYTQIPFPTNVFFSESHSSNMFYNVVFIIFHVSHCNSLIYTNPVSNEFVFQCVSF